MEAVGMILLGAVALLAVWLISTYNGLVGLRQRDGREARGERECDCGGLPKLHGFSSVGLICR